MRLPLNCTVNYIHDFLSQEDADHLFQEFTRNYRIADCSIVQEINGEQFRSNFGKITVVDQMLYEKNAFPKEIYGTTMTWPDSLQQVKDKVENMTGRTFQFCVCIYYPDGSSGVDFHSDPPAYGDTSVIPSLSLGEKREFLLKEKETGSIYSMTLASGSLLIMGEHCQEKYQHCLPVNPIYKKPRINMTFRQYADRP